MIDLLLFVPACFALNLAFGPNNLLALTHAAQAGISFAVFAAVSRVVVFAVMIAISALGLGIILSTSALVFTALKLAGAAYLIWLGIKLLRQSFDMGATALSDTPVRFRDALRREAVVAAGNPKAILIFAAFFPQFVVIESYVQSYVILGSIFLVQEITAAFAYAAAGHYAARAASSKLYLFQRGSGFGMILFGGLLLLTRRPDSI